ncbi:hypothetical protein RhiJN_21319 [Ceratobasidium sp. AG-Ba]|nr:hypothetical protein RhiJN_21319 [Ceratobasidium sp. AG-Ba]
MYFVELAKYFVFTVLACLNTSTYVSVTAINFSARAIHASAYVGLSRAGLQLPVGAFVPPPSPFSAGSLMLYVTPAAVASWPSVVDALYHVPKALGIGYQTSIQAPPSFLTISQSAYVSVNWLQPTRSSLGPSSPAYSRLAFLALNLSSSSTLLCDTILGLSPADHRAPFLAAIGLGQRTPCGVLPIQQDLVAPGMEVEDADTLIVGETPIPAESDQNYQTTDTVVIIHLRSCLIRLFALRCVPVVAYIVLQRILRLVRWMNNIFSVVGHCPGVLSILWIVVGFTLGICARLLVRREPTRAAPIGSYADPHIDILPPPPLQPPSAIEAMSTHTPLVNASTPPALTPTPTPDDSPSPKSAKQKKKNKKSKKKAGLESVAVVDPVNVQLPPDDG